ncbi:MAG TPA: response regulator [Polyangium sp.]|nr:response regulator [Polyangium sp.]
MASPIILFIDDDDRDGIGTYQRLTNLGFVARYHRGPFGTLAAIRDTQCDVVLLDVNMPGLDGPSLVRVIRHTYSQLPVLLFSNMEKAALQRIVRHIGADGSITKSAPDEELVAVLQALLEAAHIHQKSRTQRSTA